MTAATPVHSDGKRLPTIRMFSPLLRWSWVFLSAVTVLCEIAPRSPSLPPVPYYSYTASKAVLFVMVGLLSPVAFWRFDSLGLGLLFSVVATGAVEAMQSASVGHRGSYLEIAAKLVLLFVGFAYALNARYDGVMRMGVLRIGLLDAHRQARQH